MYQAFSSTARAAQDLAKITLIGNLGRDPELKQTKNDKEFVSCVFLDALPLEHTVIRLSISGRYTVATNSIGAPDADGREFCY